MADRMEIPKQQMHVRYSSFIQTYTDMSHNILIIKCDCVLANVCNAFDYNTLSKSHNDVNQNCNVSYIGNIQQRYQSANEIH